MQSRFHKIIFILITTIFSSCAKTYLIHPFPEQPFNDISSIDLKYELVFNKNYAGSIRLKKDLLRPYWTKSNVYYNNRLIGKIGIQSLIIYLDKGMYELVYKSKRDTVKFYQEGVLEFGYQSSSTGYYIYPTTINRTVWGKFYINKLINNPINKK